MIYPDYCNQVMLLAPDVCDFCRDIMFNAEDGKTFRYMNPGSPSIPKEDTKPSYIIIENGKATLIPFE